MPAFFSLPLTSELVNKVSLKYVQYQNLLKCKKSAVTVLYVYGLFVIFYLPFCITMFVETFTGYTLTVKIVYDYVGTVVYINSFLNPVVYCWRIGEVRRAVKNRLRNWKWFWDYNFRYVLVSECVWVNYEWYLNIFQKLLKFKLKDKLVASQEITIK